MSAPEESELKGGHPPAVKVGGKRVANKNPPAEKQPAETVEAAAEEQAEFGSPEKVDTHKQSLLISGVLTKGDKDYPPEAVKHYHNKPIPTHEFRAADMRVMHQAMHIQQPKK